MIILVIYNKNNDVSILLNSLNKDIPQRTLTIPVLGSFGGLVLASFGGVVGQY